MEARRKLRVVLLGDFRVGKTSLLRQFLDHKFVEQPSNTPAGMEDERTALMKLNGVEVELLLTDTAGQEQFRSFTSSYFRDKDGFLVVFSVTDANSFRNLSHWINEIRGWDDAYRVCVVGNKVDVEERAVTTREAEELVATLGSGAVYVECSAKLNINCNKVFEEIVRLCLKGTGPEAPGTAGGGTTPTSTPVNLRDPTQSQQEQKNFVCCN